MAPLIDILAGISNKFDTATVRTEMILLARVLDRVWGGARNTHATNRVYLGLRWYGGARSADVTR